MLWRRGWRSRTLAMLWAVLQFALPAAASVADAHVERESRSQVTHVESTSTTSCRPVHAAECALCQLLTHDVAPVPSAPPPRIAAEVPCPVVSEQPGLETATVGRLPLPRAPPLV